MKPIIESLQNPKIKATLRLRDSRFRRRSGQILIDGVREIDQARKAGVQIVSLFYATQTEGNDHPEGVFDGIGSPEILQPVSQRVLDKISYGERNSQAVAIAHAPEKSLAQLHLPENPLLVVLDSAEKPGNVGAVARTAYTAGANAMLLSDPRCELFNPNAIRASLGTVFALPIAVASGQDCRQWLAERRIRVFCARVDAQVCMWECNFRGALAIALGSESHGLGSQWTPGPGVSEVGIPMVPQADSLNLSVSAAILCYEAIRQRQEAFERVWPTV